MSDGLVVALGVSGGVAFFTLALFAVQARAVAAHVQDGLRRSRLLWLAGLFPVPIPCSSLPLPPTPRL